MAYASIAAAVCVAFFFEFAYCGGRVLAAILVGGMLALPAWIFLVTKHEWGAVPASAAMIVPAVWAYRVECVLPPSGGGAAMAFVVVLLYGFPSALILGAIVAKATRSRHAG